MMIKTVNVLTSKLLDYWQEISSFGAFEIHQKSQDYEFQMASPQIKKRRGGGSSGFFFQQGFKINSF